MNTEVGGRATRKKPRGVGIPPDNRPDYACINLGDRPFRAFERRFGRRVCNLLTGAYVRYIFVVWPRSD